MEYDEIILGTRHHVDQCHHLCPWEFCSARDDNAVGERYLWVQVVVEYGALVGILSEVDLVQVVVQDNY